jgi:hypothetical protein|tara:strand:- start:1300 stop:1566 length:267 start_codon:yes stop_codon:yes gene_type:complete
MNRSTLSNPAQNVTEWASFSIDRAVSLKKEAVYRKSILGISTHLSIYLGELTFNTLRRLKKPGRYKRLYRFDNHFHAKMQRNTVVPYK